MLESEFGVMVTPGGRRHHGLAAGPASQAVMPKRWRPNASMALPRISL
jgi:hypothetical protein